MRSPLALGRRLDLVSQTSASRFLSQFLCPLFLSAYCSLFSAAHAHALRRSSTRTSKERLSPWSNGNLSERRRCRACSRRCWLKTAGRFKSLPLAMSRQRTQVKRYAEWEDDEDEVSKVKIQRTSTACAYLS